MQEGMVGLAPRMRGTSSGEVQALTSPQEQMIERIICNKRTEQLKMDLALWNRAAWDGSSSTNAALRCM